nr:hypothetical protein [Streptomyces sp. AC512_CC834]
MAAITGEPLPPGASADAHGEYRSATADVALLRDQLDILGRVLGEAPPEPHTLGRHTPEAHMPGSRTPEAHTPEPRTPGSRTPEPRTPGSRTPEPRTPGPHTPEPHTPGAARPAITRRPRRRPFRLALGVLAAACAGVVVTGLGWLVVEGGSVATQDAAGGSAADRSAARPESPDAGQEAAVVFGTARYLACARLVAEGTVTAAEPVPGAAQHRITLRVTRAYAPEESTEPATTTFVLDDSLARLGTGDRVLVGVLRDRPTADTVITGDRNITTARTRITASLTDSRTLTCD